MDPSRAAGQLCTSLKMAQFERALTSQAPGPEYDPQVIAVGRQQLSTRPTAPSFGFGTAPRESHALSREAMLAFLAHVARQAATALVVESERGSFELTLVSVKTPRRHARAWGREAHPEACEPAACFQVPELI